VVKTDAQAALNQAIDAIERDSRSDETWDQLEQLADDLQAPDEVMAAYRTALNKGLAKEHAPHIADRAVKFCQAWFIDTPSAMPTLLGDIVERYPDLDWAFERLVLALTQSSQWDELLALYDRTLASTRDEKKRRQLLEDASRLAKDFADQPDRAADYLQQLIALDPGNDKLVSSLERLLERRERWDELVSLWRDQIPKLSTDDARATRAKMAAISLQKLDAPDRAVVQLRELIQESPGHDQACEQLESILSNEDTAVATRREALSLLRKTYEIVDRPDDVVRVLEQGLTVVAPEDVRAVRRALGSRMAILGRDVDALEHFAGLLLDTPDDADARRQLRQLSKRAERHDLHAQALVAAAEAGEDAADCVSLWLEAADVRRGALEDADGAVELYRRVLDSADADEADALRAAHRLNELLAADERLPVLEKLSQLEQSPSFRRQILGEAARLAEQLDDETRALASWQQILAENGQDLEALAATIAMLERAESWEQLTDALNQRARAHVSDAQRRADLVRVARTQHQRLEQPTAAIETWLAIREQFGENAEVVGALDTIMTETEHWEQLGELLDGAVARERQETSRQLVRLGDVMQRHLDKPDEALGLYQQALELDPSDEGARHGAQTLLEHADYAAAAGKMLGAAYRRTGDWSAQLELLEPRLAAMEDAREQASLLYEAAKLQRDQADDAPAALGTICRAVTLAPQRYDLRDEMLRLARDNDGWSEAATALSAASATASASPSSAAELQRQAAKILETQLGNYAEAHEAFRAAFELAPDDVAALASSARCAAHAGMWEAAGRDAIATALSLGRIDPHQISALEEAAEAQSSWVEACAAMAAAIEARAGELPPEVTSRLFGHVAEWHRDRTGDASAAAACAHRSLELMPDDVPALQRLVTLERGTPGPALTDTLLRIDAVGDERSLDALHEAATVALEADRSRATNVLEKLYRKASDLWTAGSEATGEHPVASTTSWANTQLVALLLEAEDPQRAVRILIHGGELPFEPETRAKLNLRAADMLVDLGEILRAMDAYRRALTDIPDDLDTIRKLAELAEEEDQNSGSVALRERELALCADKDERLALRLANATRAAKLESRSGRVEALLANLNDEPGHLATIDALHTLLHDRGQHTRLAEVLNAEAVRLEAENQPERAAGLWGRLADVEENERADASRAIAAHERVVTLTESNRSLDSLARLEIGQERFGVAAKWLGMRLESATPAERVAVLIKLARTHLKAGRDGEAISVLQTAFSEAPQSAEVRKLLIPLLRQREEWAALANTLAASVDHAADEATVLAYAREAANLYVHQLDTPDAAVPVLRRATDLAPDDKLLRGMLGDGLRVAGELDEARELLTQLVKDYGRRGSPERAAAHTQLAKVLHAQGDHDDALAQLDTASKMAPDDVDIVRTLSQLARDANQLERAEAALRTLLLTARRLQAAGGQHVPISTSEVLFELSSIATARGQGDQAEELAESAIEALAENDARAPLLQKKLREQGETQLLLRLLQARLRYVDSPYRRGQIIGEKASLFRILERPEDAFAAQLEAIDADPGSPLLHEGLLESAIALGKLDEYVEHLSALLEKARRDIDAMVRCEVLLRLGKVYETEHQDYDKASAAYDQAEATGVREVDVLRARASVAGARGDEDEQMRVLEHLASRGEDQVETRVDALYRIAEVQLAAEDSLEHGVESLRKALADNARPERACMILRRATERHPSHDGLLDAYEQVARDSADDQMLLHYLERRAKHADATPDQVREAAYLASSMDDKERAESLMMRAVELGRESYDGLYAVDWALLGLAEHCRDRGDIEGAVRWLNEAGTVAELEPLFALSGSVAELAASQDCDPRMTAKLYENLRERDLTARDAWEPLVGIYAVLGDTDALERVVHETLDSLQDASDRNALRMSLATALLDVPTRIDDAIQVLREALFDDPSHTGAFGLLSDSLDNAGKADELTELLRDQLSSGQDRGDAAVVKEASLRLGKKVDPQDAIRHYREALELGDDAELLATLLDAVGPEHDPSERASLGERLLSLQHGPEAAAHAKTLADLYGELQDAAGQLRVLQLGLERADDDLEIRSRLERHYRDQGDHAGLAKILVTMAESSDNAERTLELLREAAAVYQSDLAEPTSAMKLLQRARELAPTDARLCVDLAKAMASAGNVADAITMLTEALQGDGSDDTQVVLLRARCQARAATNNLDDAIADIEQAYELAPEAVADEMLALLDERRVATAEVGDGEGERRVTMRIVDIMALHAQHDDALGLLEAWTERNPNDLDALRQLRDLLAQCQHWEELERACLQLIEVESGDEQVASAALLLETCLQQGAPERARDPLEQIWSSQHDNPNIRAEVRRLYEVIGAHQELAKLLLDEARTMDNDDDRVAYLRWAGEALLSSGDVASALPALTEVLEIFPDDVQARCLLADANVLLGQFDQAHELLDEAIAKTKRSSPDLHRFHHRKAYVLSTEGNHTGQLDSLKKAHQTARKNGPIAAELADLAEAMEQWDLAVATLRTITTLDGDCPISAAVALVRQGRIALHLGDEKRARLCARRASMTDAEAEGVQQLLASLGEA